MELSEISLGILLISSISFTAAALFCEKIDFNRSYYTEIQACSKEYLPTFLLKPYSTTPDIQPYRPRSVYFLSTNFVGYSCAETTKKYSMNSNTRIDAAVFLKSTEYANIEIAVYNADLNRRVHSWINGTATGQPGSWFTLHGIVTETIPNALVEVKAYTTQNTAIAIEFLHISNVGVQSPECMPNTMEPTKKPETQQPTKPPTPDHPAQPPKPNGCQSFGNNESNWWIVIIVCASVLVIIFIIIGIYCIVDSARSRYRHDCTAK